MENRNLQLFEGPESLDSQLSEMGYMSLEQMRENYAALRQGRADFDASVVVPIYSQEDFSKLARVTDSLLRNQTQYAIEIIPVINGPEKQLQIEQSKGWNFFNEIGMVPQYLDHADVEMADYRPPKISAIFATRNLGFDLANSPKVLALDVDSKVNGEWVTSMVESLDTNVFVACPIQYETPQTLSKLILREFSGTIREAKRMIKGPLMQGAGHGIRKDLVGAPSIYNLAIQAEQEMPSRWLQEIGGEESLKLNYPNMNLLSYANNKGRIFTPFGYQTWSDYLKYGVARNLKNT